MTRYEWLRNRRAEFCAELARLRQREAELVAEEQRLLRRLRRQRIVVACLPAVVLAGWAIGRFVGWLAE